MNTPDNSYRAGFSAAHRPGTDTLDNAMVKAWVVLQGEIEKWKGRQTQ